MKYNTLTVKSPYAIKRLSHNARFNTYCNRIELFCDRDEKKKNILDYGTGDGYLFNRLLNKKRDDINCFAFEPLPKQYEELVENINKNDLNVSCFQILKSNKYFDYILCAEVLEHFSARNIIEHLKTFEKILAKDGKVLISVPVEIGFGGFCKNIARWFIGGLHEGLGVQSAIKSFFGLPIYRGDNFYISSHTGFSHKQLEYLIIDTGWEIEKKFYSPLPIVGAIVNSQIYFEITRR